MRLTIKPHKIIEATRYRDLHGLARMTTFIGKKLDFSPLLLSPLQIVGWLWIGNAGKVRFFHPQIQP